jgi:cyclomaltodextrinase
MNNHFIIGLILSILLTCCSQNSKRVEVPDWSKKAVWYQIFPERFWNGDPTNNPTLDDIKQGWPYLQPEGWQTHLWNSDWYQLQPWELATGRGFYENAALRRYGGDLQGVLDRLPYLQELGINAIYFNPLFESPSHHKYDATMYHHIDNNFGPNPEKDKNIWQEEDPAEPSSWQWTSADSLFLVLIQACHQQHIKVIIDGVFNHVNHHLLIGSLFRNGTIPLPARMNLPIRDGMGCGIFRRSGKMRMFWQPVLQSMFRQF